MGCGVDDGGMRRQNCCNYTQKLVPQYDLGVGMGEGLTPSQSDVRRRWVHLKTGRVGKAE